MTEQTPDVLRASPITIKLASIDGQSVDEYHLVLDLNTMADIEARYASEIEAPERDETTGQPKRGEDGKIITTMVSGLMHWQEAMLREPYSAVRATLAIALGIDEREAGARAIPTEMQKYAQAIGVAFAIANGVDPTEAMQKIEAMTATVPTPFGIAGGAEQAAIPTQTGSPDGAVPDETPPPSGG